LPDRSFLSADLTAGSDPANPAARLVVVGKAIPGRAQLFAEEDGFERSLSSAELFRADQGGVHHEVAWVGNLDSNGYQIQISGKSADNVTLSVTFPGAGGKLVSAVVGPFPVIPGSIAFVDVFNGTDQTTWTLNGTNFTPMSGATQIDPRPELTLIKAVQDLEADPRGHALSLLFNRALQDEPNRDPLKYQVRSEFGINPIQAVLPQAFDPRRVILGVTNHPSPYASIVASVTGLIDASGQPVAPDPQTATLDVRDRTPGGAVEGFVIGADGQPVPNAEVILRMPAISDITGQTFLDDFAAAKADGSGHFFFEYIPIRQGTVFTLAAADPVTGYDGDAAGQIQTEGRKLQLNIVLLARGDVTGKVVDENGAPIPNAFITADSVFFKGGRNSATGNSAPDGTYLFTAMPVGPVQLWAIDPASRKTAYQVAFIPAAGAKAVQNLVIVAGARASVSGQVILERDRSPAVGVYVVTYGETVAVPYPPFFDRKYLGYRITDSNGAFAFNDIQPGQDTIQVFDFTRSLSAVVAKDVTVLADSQTVLQLVIPEPEAHVGSVAGFIRSSKSGVVTPLANAVVYVSGTPARTTTDAQGHYQLDGVPIGSRGVSAYNPATQKFVSGNALIQEGLIASLDLLFVTTANISGLVVDPLNRFVPNAAVAEFDAAGNVAHGTTADANGRFVFEGLSPGGHTFYAFAKDDTSGKLQDDIGAATINFVGDQDASIVISLLGYGSIHGKVVSTQLGQDGQPIDSPVAAHLTLQPPKLLKVGGFALIVDPASELYPGPDETDSLATDGTYSFASVLGGRF
ncbi:MAG TPA: carboxypeptidase regulatory-like domain-containing protein, partial [Thermoanaerobaculia bacterium]